MLSPMNPSGIRVVFRCESRAGSPFPRNSRISSQRLKPKYMRESLQGANIPVCCGRIERTAYDLPWLRCSVVLQKHFHDSYTRNATDGWCDLDIRYLPRTQDEEVIATFQTPMYLSVACNKLR